MVMINIVFYWRFMMVEAQTCEVSVTVGDRSPDLLWHYSRYWL